MLYSMKYEFKSAKVNPLIEEENIIWCTFYKVEIAGY